MKRKSEFELDRRWKESCKQILQRVVLVLKMIKTCSPEISKGAMFAEDTEELSKTPLKNCMWNKLKANGYIKGIQ